MTDDKRDEIHRAMVRLATGDREAFGTVFDGLWIPLRAFAMRVTGNHPESEDIAQRTLLKVFSRISDFDTSRDGVAWAFGIATFELKTFRKQTQRRKEHPEIDPGQVATSVSTPEQSAIDAQLQAALVEVLGELRPSDREALMPEGRGSTPLNATWRKRRQRALVRLREIWSRRYE